jgi:hypothetical protein
MNGKKFLTINTRLFQKFIYAYKIYLRLHKEIIKSPNKTSKNIANGKSIILEPVDKIIIESFK